MRGHISQAREGEERGRGIPLSTVERACRHYGITPEQYLANPEAYPLPERGAGLQGGNMRGQSSPIVAKAERVVRDYQIGQGGIAQDVSIPGWLFGGAIGLAIGIVLGPTILASTKEGARRLGEMAESKLRSS
jgi:hypothetical protein